MAAESFEDLLFFHCYDCGWGEKGVLAARLSFGAAYARIEALAGKDAAAEWARTQDHCFAFPTGQAMVSEAGFVEAEWDGSQDY